MNTQGSIEERVSARFIQFQFSDFRKAKLHLRITALVIYYFIALTP